MLRKRFVDTRGGVADVYIGETASRLPRPKDATSELETSRNIPTSSGTPFSRTDENTDKARAWISFKNTRRKVVPHWPGSEASTTPEKQIIHLKEPSEKQQMNVDSRVAKERLLADGGIPSPGTDEVETQLDRWLSSQFDVSEFPNITRLPSPKPNPPDQSSSSSHGSSEFGFSNINTPLSSSLNHPKSSSSDGHFGFSIDSSDTTSHSRGPILDRESASHGRIPLPGRNYESFNIVGRVGDMNRDQLVEEIRAVVHDAMQEFTMALNSASKEAYQD